MINCSGATLKEAQDIKRLHVEIGDGLNELQIAEVLQQAELGTLADGYAFLRPASLRSLAGPLATPEWDRAFTAMAEYARSKGWVNADGNLQAHLEHKEAGQTN